MRRSDEGFFSRYSLTYEGATNEKNCHLQGVLLCDRCCFSCCWSDVEHQNRPGYSAYYFHTIRNLTDLACKFCGHGICILWDYDMLTVSAERKTKKLAYLSPAPVQHHVQPASELAGNGIMISLYQPLAEFTAPAGCNCDYSCWCIHDGQHEADSKSRRWICTDHR